MAIVKNILLPIITFIIYASLLGGFAYLVYWLFTTFFPDFRWAFKYKVLRRKYDEKEVEYCLHMTEKEKTYSDVIKDMLLKQNSFKEARETGYIFNQVKKSLKGGMQHG